MKYIKTAFLVALFNYLIVSAIVLAVRSPTKTATMIPSTIEPTATTSPKPSLTPTLVVKKILNGDPFAGIFGGAAPTTTQKQNTVVSSNPAAAPTQDTRCIITIDGQGYNVTAFRNQHSGGNIFVCGTDMSKTFHNQHPNSFLNIMAQYKI